MGYRVHYYKGHHYQMPSRIAKVYPSLSAACKGRDRLMKLHKDVSSAYLVSVLANGMEFCALSDRYAKVRA